MYVYIMVYIAVPPFHIEKINRSYLYNLSKISLSVDVSDFIIHNDVYEYDLIKCLET